MKKQTAKTISTLSLLLALSAGAVNVLAFPCETPNCQCCGRPMTRVSAQDIHKQEIKPVEQRQEIKPAEQTEDFFGFAFFLVQLAMGFRYLP